MHSRVAQLAAGKGAARQIRVLPQKPVSNSECCGSRKKPEGQRSNSCASPLGRLHGDIPKIFVPSSERHREAANRIRRSSRGTVPPGGADCEALEPRLV